MLGILEIRNIFKKFEKIAVLNDISFSVNKGEIISILGPSGCGKTTLLNVILGLFPADKGEIIFNGKNITKLHLQHRGFNIVFQDYALFPNLTAIANIKYGLKNNPNISNNKEIEELIYLLELEKHLYKKIDQLSGGQKQRVAIARTLVMKPKVLLLDEPLSALDGIIKENIKKKIKEIIKNFNLTTLIVTHNPEEAMYLSDKILLLNQGKIEQFASPKEILNNPISNFTKKFILAQLYLQRNNILELFNGS